jgi:DNA adenine methylase
MPRNAILKWHGGKTYLAPRILELFPEPEMIGEPSELRAHYVEPYFGGGAVLLAREYPDYHQTSEVANDINGQLTTFWKVLQDEELFPQFQRRALATPYSRPAFEEARSLLAKAGATAIETAWSVFVMSRQSQGGRMRSFPPMVKNRHRGGMQDHVNGWWGAVDLLPKVHDRLRRVVIYQQDALEVIRREDSPKTVFYLDPPYLHETRTSQDVYAHEMSDRDHAELLETIKQCQGKVLLSGYPSRLYDEQLQDWDRTDIKIPNQSSNGRKKPVMTECVWRNFSTAPRSSGPDHRRLQQDSSPTLPGLQ